MWLTAGGSRATKRWHDTRKKARRACEALGGNGDGASAVGERHGEAERVGAALGEFVVAWHP